MTTNKTHAGAAGSNPKPAAPGARPTRPLQGGDVGYAGVVGIDDVPSFWGALCRYRERHGLTDPQRAPLLDDTDLDGLRDTAPARDFSFDASDARDPTSDDDTASPAAPTLARRDD